MSRDDRAHDREKSFKRSDRHRIQAAGALGLKNQTHQIGHVL